MVGTGARFAGCVGNLRGRDTCRKRSYCISNSSVSVARFGVRDNLEMYGL